MSMDENKEMNIDLMSEEELQELFKKDPRAYKMAKAAKLVATPGHPLHTMTRENAALKALITEAMNKIDSGEDVSELVSQIRNVAVYYAKKGDIFYPHLKHKYEIAGPSDVMWTEDDEIRDELASLDKSKDHDEYWLDRVKDVLKRADAMIYKDDKIFFPMCAVNFTQEEWYGIYEDAKDYGTSFGVEAEVWTEAEQFERAENVSVTDKITMPGGSFTVEQLRALLNTIPMEITFIDADDINCFFNEGPKLFKRPAMALGREVYSCHPPKIEPMVRAILDDFKAGRRDSVPVWSEKGGRAMLVTYMAVRDHEGKYLGTVELVQDMQGVKEHFDKIR